MVTVNFSPLSDCPSHSRFTAFGTKLWKHASQKNFLVWLHSRNFIQRILCKMHFPTYQLLVSNHSQVECKIMTLSHNAQITTN